MSAHGSSTLPTPPRVLRDADNDSTTHRNVAHGLADWMRSPAADFYTLLIAGGMLIGLGLIMVLSSSSISFISQDASGWAGLHSQGTFALLGVVPLAAAALLPLRLYKKVAWPVLGVSLLLQVLVFSPLGVEVNGNRNWIDVGFRIQPSEMVKLALAMWLGLVLATKRRLLDQWKHILVPVAPVAGLAVLLVLLGHDLGTTLVLVILVAGALWVAGVPKRVFGLGAALAGLAVAAMVLTSPNRMRRIFAWLGDDCDLAAECYQSAHGLMALAEGGWWGVGLGASRQKWGLLPHAENDYIFAIIGEELGLVGTLTVIALFAALAVAMVRIIRRHPDPFVQITTAAIMAWLLGQALINMSVVTGLLPVIGVPLPFVSMGGSALIVCMTALGVLLAFARDEPGARAAISARASVLKQSFTVVPGIPTAPRRRRFGSPRGRARRRQLVADRVRHERRRTVRS